MGFAGRGTGISPGRCPGATAPSFGTPVFCRVPSAGGKGTFRRPSCSLWRETHGIGSYFARSSAQTVCGGFLLHFAILASNLILNSETLRWVIYCRERTSGISGTQGVWAQSEGLEMGSASNSNIDSPVGSPSCSQQGSAPQIILMRFSCF